MNPWLNPLFTLRAIKSFTFDINRLERWSKDKLTKYQNQRFKKMIQYAFSVPIYKEKYEKMNIQLKDIRKINDIIKLPLISKDDIRQGYPDKVIPNNFNKIKNDLAVTSGSSGSPIGLYCEPIIGIKFLSAWARILHAHNKHWLTTKTTAILDRGVITDIENEISRNSVRITPSIINYRVPKYLKNVQQLNATEPIDSLAKKIETFRPDFLIGHPGVLKAIAYLKKSDIIGKNIKPSLIASGGGLLDKYTRKYIEESFEASVIDVYASTEGELTAFQCREGNYHIQSDIIYLEILDKNNMQVDPGETGRIVVTRLYGKGTPIIRYTGLSDIAVYSKNQCNCGITSQLIEKIEGRTADCIILPDGRVIPPYSFLGIIVDVLTLYGMEIINQFQIIQEKINKIKIMVVKNEKILNNINLYENVINEIAFRYKKKLGDEVSISIIQVEEIKKTKKNQTIAPLIISHVVTNKPWQN